MGNSLAGRALGTAPRREAAFVGQELERADVLGGIAVATVAAVVALERVGAGAVRFADVGDAHSSTSGAIVLLIATDRRIGDVGAQTGPIIRQNAAPRRSSAARSIRGR